MGWASVWAWSSRGRSSDRASAAAPCQRARRRQRRRQRRPRRRRRGGRGDDADGGGRRSAKGKPWKEEGWDEEQGEAKGERCAVRTNKWCISVNARVWVCKRLQDEHRVGEGVGSVSWCFIHQREATAHLPSAPHGPFSYTAVRGAVKPTPHPPRAGRQRRTRVTDERLATPVHHGRLATAVPAGLAA